MLSLIVFVAIVVAVGIYVDRRYFRPAASDHQSPDEGTEACGGRAGGAVFWAARRCATA